MTDNVVTLKVRVPPSFREMLIVTAKVNKRSMNQEIINRLEQSFDAHQPTAKEISRLTDQVESLIESVNRLID